MPPPAVSSPLTPADSTLVDEPVVTVGDLTIIFPKPDLDINPADGRLNGPSGRLRMILEHLQYPMKVSEESIRTGYLQLLDSLWEMKFLRGYNVRVRADAAFDMGSMVVDGGKPWTQAPIQAAIRKRMQELGSATAAELKDKRASQQQSDERASKRSKTKKGSR